MKVLRYAAMAFLAVSMIACGGEEKKEEKESIKIGTKKAKKSSNKGTTIALAGNDMMKYDKTEFTVKAGEEVTLNFRHTGKIGIKVMGHNLVLLKQGTEIPAFSAKAAAAGEASDWIPENGKDVIAHTKMLGGGQSTSITFTAPAAGTYDFICSFPGHSGLMKGKFIVQ